MTTRDSDPTRDASRDETGDDRSSRAKSDCFGERRDRHRRRRRHHRGHRKERVLHTRISEQLADDIRELAEDLRVPTSNLVRNVLEEVFTMVESVSGDVGELFEDVLDEAEDARDRVRRRAERSRSRASGRPRARRERRESRADGFDRKVENELRRDEQAEQEPGTDGPAEAERPTFPDVLGWQQLVLNHDRVCLMCGVQMPRGTHAYVGLGPQGLTDTMLCRACTGLRD